MSTQNKLVKKLQNALKLSGFLVRRELCSLLVDKFNENEIDLDNVNIFESCIKKLSTSLENQCTLNQSIEKEHILQAIEICLQSGYDKYETIFNVINAFDFPKLYYDLDRKLYFPSRKKSTILPDADAKAQLFLDRYYTILQRTKRNFQKKARTNDDQSLNLQTVDYLLTLSRATLEYTLVLGSLIQISDGKFYLEDPTGLVQLDLTHAKYHGGFFVENGFVLVNGVYEDKILQVSTVLLPPGEEYADSRPTFGSLNYFGGLSKVPLKDSRRLKEHLMKNAAEMFMFFSDVWLDHPMVFQKLEILFDGLQTCPPIAFVFMGNFMSESHGSERIVILKKLFKQLGELINNYPNIVNQSQFIFIPGLSDPCIQHMAPRLPLPEYITNEMSKILPRAIFTTNPCRIQYCTREIVLFRADLMAKFLQGTLHKPKKDEIAEYITRTVICQGHLSPVSLNALPVHWDFDYTLRLYPLPDLIVIGDKSEMYQGTYKGCQLINPGSFCESGFQFKSYIPATNTVDDCIL